MTAAAKRKDPRGSGRRSPTAGNRGQGGKWIWPATRLKIYERDGWRCVWCQRAVERPGREGLGHGEAIACLDHILPRASGGTHAPSNLLTSCLDCNEERGDRSALEYATESARHRGGRLDGYVDVEARAAILERVLTAMATPIVRQSRKAKKAA